MPEEFVARTARFVAEHIPPGTLGTPGAETALARACWVLGGWETGYRTGRLPDALAAVHAHHGYTAEDLRAAAPEQVVANWSTSSASCTSAKPSPAGAATLPADPPRPGRWGSPHRSSSLAGPRPPC